MSCTPRPQTCAVSGPVLPLSLGHGPKGKAWPHRDRQHGCGKGGRTNNSRRSWGAPGLESSLGAKGLWCGGTPQGHA